MTAVSAGGCSDAEDLSESLELMTVGVQQYGIVRDRAAKSADAGVGREAGFGPTSRQIP